MKQLSLHKILQNETKQIEKWGKKEDISVQCKVTDWVGDLHTDKNNF